ncbi:MAG: aminopeptidase P family protein [Bacteroides sp.]|nr:aminopeptidase P family protein [Bacteroides sp.]MBD5320417.1 aminopeptidase P family protein [Bacteroides sp.]
MKKEPLQLLPAEEASLRLDKVSSQLKASGTEAMLAGDNATLYYLTGRVFAGYAYITDAGEATFFIRRPVELEGDNVVYIHKPEHIPDHLTAMPKSIALELDITPYSAIGRLQAIFPEAKTVNASPMLQAARATKTAFEIEKIRQSGIRQERVYRLIPKLYRPGMTDLELQVEIERASRLEGCLGQFRISGTSMELYMANLLVGDNADNPTPYDFAMGGAGLDPSLPVGCNGTEIRPGESVMADVNGNYTGYMTDMTRTFALGELSPIAMKAHQCSIDICRELSAMARPGTPAKALYVKAEDMAKEAGLHEYFMGHRQKAGFVGHGLGIEINEHPVIAPRSRDIIAEGNVFALEPKFVIPGTGAVGIENTYCVGADKTECLTNAPEPIIYFD